MSNNKSVVSSRVQRPNENLLNVGKLHSPKSVGEANTPATYEVEIWSEANVESDATNHLPPLYESVVKLENDNVSLPSTSQLPKYQDVAGLQDAPPTYHSLFTDRMLRAINPFSENGEAVVETANVTETNQNKYLGFVLNFFLFLFLISFVLLLPVSMVVLGIIFIHSCPAQPRIPIYLIVLGFFQMLECCGRLGYKLFQGSHQHNSWRERYRRKDPLVYFVIVWFVIGSMWVYQTNPNCKYCSSAVNQNTTTLNTTITPTDENVAVLPELKPMEYCDKVIYNFAFWIITTYYSIIGFFCLMILVDVTIRAINKCCCSQTQ